MRALQIPKTVRGQQVAVLEPASAMALEPASLPTMKPVLTTPTAATTTVNVIMQPVHPKRAAPQLVFVDLMAVLVAVQIIWILVPTTQMTVRGQRVAGMVAAHAMALVSATNSHPLLIPPTTQAPLPPVLRASPTQRQSVNFFPARFL